MDEVRQVTQRLQDHRLAEEHSELVNITSLQVCISLLVYDVSPHTFRRGQSPGLSLYLV